MTHRYPYSTIMKGRRGYLDATRRVMGAARRLRTALESVRGVRVLGEPMAMVISFASEEVCTLYVSKGNRKIRFLSMVPLEWVISLSLSLSLSLSVSLSLSLSLSAYLKVLSLILSFFLSFSLSLSLSSSSVPLKVQVDPLTHQIVDGPRPGRRTITRKLNIFTVDDGMKAKGYSLNALRYPSCLHVRI